MAFGGIYLLFIHLFSELIVTYIIGRPWKITLHTEFYQRKYLAHFCSWANIFALLVLVIVIVLPFLLTFSTNNFWKKTSYYLEHPIV